MKNLNSQKGFSITEALIVVIIISVLVVMSVAQFGSAKTKFEAQKIARQLKNDFERARFDSVKRRPYTIETMSNVVIESSTSYSLILDLDEDGVLEDVEKRTVDFSSSDIKLFTNNVAFPVKVVFDRRGKISARDSADNEVSSEFVICDYCSSYDTAKSEDYKVIVALTGTITMLRYNESLQTYQIPTSSTVGSGDDINSLVTTGTGTTSTPVPTPSIIPTPTPTSTPVGTATPTPTPTSTPAPTPTVDLCVHNERPSQTGCVCQAPMSLFRNGQCKS